MTNELDLRKKFLTWTTVGSNDCERVASVTHIPEGQCPILTSSGNQVLLCGVACQVTHCHLLEIFCQMLFKHWKDRK